MIAPTAPGSRESLDGTNTGYEDKKQAVDGDNGLEIGSGCPCVDPVPNAMVGVLFESTGEGALPNLLMPAAEELTSGCFTPVPDGKSEDSRTLAPPEATTPGPLAAADTELQVII